MTAFPTCVLFDTRAFNFAIPEDEVENLQGHLEILIQSAHAVDILTDHCSRLDDLNQGNVEQACVAAKFVTGIVSSMIEVLQASRSKS